jgi:antitoxin YefM
MGMNVLTYSETRANLKDVMDRVVSDRSPVIVSRQRSESVVIVSLADWNAIQETMHLLSTPTNADRLRSAVDELNSGAGTPRELVPSQIG